MKFGHFFIERPRFAGVLSILLIIIGLLAFGALPVSQYPEISPPTINVSASYPGATAETIADTVATPIEQAVNGVENMLYMTSSSTAGQLSLDITFELGTDLDTAQVLVQNRVAQAEPRLPAEVRNLGVVVQKRSPDLMMVVHLLSPDGTFDNLYISNYAQLQVVDVLKRIKGIGDITVFGTREYSMRVWLDPDRLAALNLTATDVIQALRAQNVQVAAGTLGQPPMKEKTAYQFSVNTQGRFNDVEQFKKVIIKSGEEGRLARIEDVARVELGARDYGINSFLNGKMATGLGIFQLPGGNALETAAAIHRTMEELSKDFPDGLTYKIAYDPTQFVEESMDAVYQTIFEAALLVIVVIILFLQSWRAALIPIIAIPVSLIGTFAVMAMFGFSLNTLSLFGLVLAIGIVVDDAIVVVENIERNLELGKSPREAAHITMDEVGTALISIALVLSAVFVPAAFLGGITGEFFRQFALTIAVATIISAFNSLTLSPALGAILLREKGAPRTTFGRIWNAVLGPVFRVFNAVFDKATTGYERSISQVIRRPYVSLSVFGVLLLVMVGAILRIPTGFIPQQDMGYLIVSVELPKGASLQRTTDVVLEATDEILEVPGVGNVVGIAGFSGATFASASNAAAMFVLLEQFEDRAPGITAAGVAAQIRQKLGHIMEAGFFVIDPPPVRGLGQGGGFKMMVQDRSGQGLRALEAESWKLIGMANQDPMIQFAFTTYGTNVPRYWLDIDRTKVEMLDVPIDNVFSTLQAYLGSAYVNDFNLFGRTYRVTVQADSEFRLTPDDITDLRTRSRSGKMVPLGSLLEVRKTTGPDRVVRHNLYPAAEVQGSAMPGVSTGAAIEVMERLAAQGLQSGFGYEWTEIAYQEKKTGNVGLLIFPLSVLFVFLVLTAQYESWSLPLAIILIVPLCILFALGGIWLRGMDNNILTQIGFIVLIGLASKNAILVVEFAKQQEEEGRRLLSAVVEAARLRLRPILMTSIAFILGVVPLVFSSGAGAEMRQVLGTAVFSGMIGVTLTGLFLTPVFYVVIRRFVTGQKNDNSLEIPEPDKI
ncbi:efflux RND transporter permease subunit [Luteithermobacter gelatinilyticus]|uniref:efflux RND transporter permease subunit n=1 Tax=Luteithermobacter gelatinilyticus TaxID=2582913 RepID=UPI0011058ED7|nr:multidrug efflux RND transporter permease subunit [Luteithermobacter gelatinilyticus]